MSTKTESPPRKKSAVQEALDALPSKQKGGDGKGGKPAGGGKPKGAGESKPKAAAGGKPTPAPPAPTAAEDAEAERLRQEYAKKWLGWPKTNVPVESVVVGERYRKTFDEAKEEELAQSIARLGLLQPIVVRKSDNVLIAGERRLRAVKRLGMAKVPAVMVDGPPGSDPEIQALEWELEENSQRADVTFGEKMAMVDKIEAMYKARGRPAPGQYAEKQRVRVAKAAGLSHETVRFGKVVKAAAEKDPERFGDLAKKMAAGEVAPKTAHAQVVRQMADELDGAGVPLHAKVKQAFVWTGEFDRHVKSLRLTLNGVSDLADTPGGRRMVETMFAKFKLRERVTADPEDKDKTVRSNESHLVPLLDAIEVLHDGRPFCQCPVCLHETGELGKYLKTCRACYGHGHVSEKTWNALSKAGDPGVTKMAELAAQAVAAAEKKAAPAAA